MIQTEAELERSLINRLQGLGYEYVEIRDAKGLKDNLKAQLERFNQVSLSEAEFQQVLIKLDKGNVFDRAHTLRDRLLLVRDNGTPLHLRLLNSEAWCQNLYQVTHQVEMAGRYKNRYDVTLLINGLPLVQIELKRSGVELKTAFHQINRYQRHSFWSENGLFQFVQLFVISNGVNTKYYANNRKQDFNQTFSWTDEENKLITRLEPFTDLFLEKCHLSKMICRYIVLHSKERILMVLRPYQYYAVEAIVKRVEESRRHGYIWHTTGSGKTLTSFKAAQIMTSLPKVHKVLFVVDRADLDYKTTEEFNNYEKDCVDNTTHTYKLFQQLKDDNKKLIVTTIQKLNRAIHRPQYEATLQALRDKRMVFIFDECHRSQFGETHQNIVKFFPRVQLFGFTGTPIFADNAVGTRTTKDLFDDCLHRYLITNAIADENVLKFSVEYWGKLKRKDGSLIDEQVLTIDKKEFFENEERIGKVVDWIIEHHEQKTYKRQFSAILCVGSVDALIRYYQLFKMKKEAGAHDLRVVTVFTSAINEPDAEANGLIEEPDFDHLNGEGRSADSREHLESFIADYNATYKVQHSARDGAAFYTYYKDVQKRMKDRDYEGFCEENRIDILLVVNMFLTGFDVKKLNTLYVDKNLRHHGLVQAYSRTNRPLGELKSQGNIVCFRNLKDNTDKAIALFSNKDAVETILVEPYDRHVELFNQEVLRLKLIAATPDEVNQLICEEDVIRFVRSFRQLIRLQNVLKTFTEFSFADLDLDEQTFEDFKSKYLDIYDRSKAQKEAGAASIIDEVDFELELIRRDEINVAYILKLLVRMKQSDSVEETEKEKEDRRKELLDLLTREVQLRSKRDLIERFINEQMVDGVDYDALHDRFVVFWNEERAKEVELFCQAEHINHEAFETMIEGYHFSGKTPLREEVFALLDYQPKVLERKIVFERITKKMFEIIDRFDEHMGDM